MSPPLTIMKFDMDIIFPARNYQPIQLYSPFGADSVRMDELHWDTCQYLYFAMCQWNIVWRRHVTISAHLQKTIEDFTLWRLIYMTSDFSLAWHLSSYFFLYSALEVFLWLCGTIIKFVYNNNNNCLVCKLALYLCMRFMLEKNVVSLVSHFAIYRPPLSWEPAWQITFQFWCLILLLLWL